MDTLDPNTAPARREQPVLPYAPPIESAREEASPPASLAMYAAAFAVTCCGLFATHVCLEDAGFTNLVFGLTVVGFVVSYMSRRQNISSKAVEVPALVLCAFVFLLAIVGDQPFLAPAGVAEDRARSLVVLLTWLVVFRSFTLVNDGALMFCCVPAIALLGLVNTITSDGVLVTAFLVCVCAAAFLMVHENFLRTRTAPSAADERPARSARPTTVLSQVQAASVCVAGAVIAANFLVVPLRAVGSQFRVSSALPAIAHTVNLVTGGTNIRVFDPQTVSIATGPVVTSDEKLMYVEAPRPDYWRGMSFDLYTGHGWTNTLKSTAVEADPNLPPSADGFRIDLHHSTIMGPQSHRTPMRQRIWLQHGVFSQLYAAAEPRSVTIQEPRANEDGAGTVGLNQPEQGYTYVVDSEVPDASPSALRATGDRYPADIRSRYLQLPDDPEVVASLRAQAQRVTAGKRNNFDRVDALIHWIDDTCKYNTGAAAVPAGRDVVSYFLFEEKEGYCDSFAAALAVLCRTLGIPSRVASGFLTGERDDTTGRFVVRERDKHQWTEVYFPDVGWIKFDATAGATDISGTASARTHGSRGLGYLLFGRGWLPPLALLTFLAMLAYVVKVEIIDRLRDRALMANPLGLPPTNLAILCAFQEACRELARRGLPRPPAATPFEYLAMASHRLDGRPEVAEPLMRLTSALVRSRYSGAPASEEEARRAAADAAELRAALRGGPRRLTAAVPAPDSR